MISTRPYLLRALFDWCVDQGFTPHIQVHVDGATRVPREFVRDGVIVLNIGPEATHQLSIGNDEISFQARFNGNAFPVLVPVGNVTAIFARENGQGMGFEYEAFASTDEAATEFAGAVASPAADEAAAVDPAEGDVPADLPPDDDRPSPPPVSRGHLKRVK